MMPEVAILMLQFLLIMPFTAAEQPINRKPGCNETCGAVSIPYPFGIGSNCSAEGFEIECNMTNGTYMPRIFGVEVLNISISLGQIRVNNPIAHQCYDSHHKIDDITNSSLLLGSSFQFNSEKNKFTVIGCNTIALVAGDKYIGVCYSFCESHDILVNGSCSGAGCCQTPISEGINNIYEVTFLEEYNNSLIYNYSACGYAVVTEYAELEFNSLYITTDELSKREGMPVVLDWTIGNQTCHSAQLNKSTYACASNNSVCVESNVAGSYLCNCSFGYHGNPYLAGGCQDINECIDQSKCIGGACENMPGSYRCICPSGTQNVSSNGGNRCQPIPKQKLELWAQLLIGVSLGFVVVILCFSFMCAVNQRRKLAKIKKKYFQQYGGRLLLEEMKSRHGHTFTLFSEKELREATNGFDDSTMVGKGGFGKVYKGTLKNNDVVAIKRCQTIDERQKKEFGKEMLILSEINHKNIVRILGCCLEVEVPILVYEFIPNGTLFDLIHVKRGLRIPLSTRLRVATEAAESLAYLHSSINPLIVHGDVKSSNILLDENFMAKVSDFGASMLAPTDQDQFLTVVQGTRGYLDPEYVQYGQLTVKSDVYSFGVVLLELLTRKKPISFDGPEGDMCLSSSFLSAMKENELDEILDDEIVAEDNLELIKEVAKLAKMCSNIEGEKRPEMKQVAEELDKLRKTMKQPSGGDNLEEIESLLTRGESSKSQMIEITDVYSLEKKATLAHGR